MTIREMSPNYDRIVEDHELEVEFKKDGLGRIWFRPLLARNTDLPDLWWCLVPVGLIADAERRFVRELDPRR